MLPTSQGEAAREALALVTPQDLDVWLFPDVWVAANKGVQETIAAGAVVCSWVVHFDPETVELTAPIFLNFGQDEADLLGIIGTADGQYLENPDVVYGSPDSVGSSDLFRTRPGAVWARLNGRVDTFRVLLAC